MTAPFTDAQRRLLHQLLARREPKLLRTIERSGLVTLSEVQRGDVEDAISDEFAAAGRLPDDEPNAYGMELEYLLDAVLRFFRAAPPAA